MKRSSIVKDISNSIAENQQPGTKKPSRSSLRTSKNNIATNENNEQDHHKNQEENEMLEKIEKEFNSLYIEINTLKLGYEELRENSADVNKKQLKHSHNIDELKQGLKKLEKQAISDN